MGSHSYEDLMRHAGHEIVCVTYGDPDEPANVAVECETCHEVIQDYDRPWVLLTEAKTGHPFIVEFYPEGDETFEDKTPSIRGYYPSREDADRVARRVAEQKYPGKEPKTHDDLDGDYEMGYYVPGRSGNVIVRKNRDAGVDA